MFGRNSAALDALTGRTPIENPVQIDRLRREAAKAAGENPDEVKRVSQRLEGMTADEHRTLLRTAPLQGAETTAN